MDPHGSWFRVAKRKRANEVCRRTARWNFPENKSIFWQSCSRAISRYLFSGAFSSQCGYSPGKTWTITRSRRYRVPSLVGSSFPRELELFLVSRKLAKFRGPLIEFHNISSNFPDECLPRNLRSEDRGNSLEVPSISGKCDQQEARWNIELWVIGGNARANFVARKFEHLLFSRTN